MSGKPQAVDGTESADSAKPPAKSKKMLVIGGLILVLALVGGGAFVFISKQRAAVDEDTEETVGSSKASAHAPSKSPPVYLPLDNMVVNLADPGGERVVQVGLIMVVRDAKAGDSVKAYLPTIRSGILMQISRLTAEELLKAEGKEKLARDILREASLPFGGGDEEFIEETPGAKKSKPRKKVTPVEYPVLGVLFSSIIVQ